MYENKSGNAKRIIATLRIEVKSSKGRIILPGLKPILLAENSHAEAVTIPEKVILHDGEMLQVGRDGDNNLILDIPKVSRFHALFTATSSRVILSDLASTNGTFVNGVPITSPVQVAAGDIVEIKPAKITVGLDPARIHQTDSQSVETEVDLRTSAAIVTVLVVDVCRYTHLSGVLPARDIIVMLHRWFDRVSKIIQKFGGKVDKYIGDCVMAFWRGSTDNVKLKANEATKAAIEIIKETQKLSKSPQWIHGGNYPWNCRVSLNTGQVRIGVIGARGSRDFTVWGEVVNLAFHLNTIGSKQGYDLIISGSTADYIKDYFELKDLGPVEVKGHNQKVVVYTLS